MPRGFERNIDWSNDGRGDKKIRLTYIPFAQTTCFPWSDYDLGFLASCKIKA